MVDNTDDREDFLSQVKDNAVRLGNELRDIADLIGDPSATSPDRVKDVVRLLKFVLNDSDDLGMSLDQLECVAEFDELGG